MTGLKASEYEACQLVANHTVAACDAGVGFEDDDDEVAADYKADQHLLGGRHRRLHEIHARKKPASEAWTSVAEQMKLKNNSQETPLPVRCPSGFRSKALKGSTT